MTTEEWDAIPAHKPDPLYFAKLLPIDVNADIKINYPLQDDYWPSRRWNNDGTDYIDMSGREEFKLFLCSKDIQVGDKVMDEKGQIYHADEGNIHFIGDTIQGYKVIGEISPDATWVKEGDEFTEEELSYKYDGAYLHLTHWMPDVLKIIGIKGPCGHFH
jgi:hypothetical protein